MNEDSDQVNNQSQNFSNDNGQNTFDQNGNPVTPSSQDATDPSFVTAQQPQADAAFSQPQSVPQEPQKRFLPPAPSIANSQNAPAAIVVDNQPRTSIAIALFGGLVIGALLVASMWFYLNENTYTYEIQRNSSVLAEPGDIQELLARIEPATVAVSIGGGLQRGGSAGTGFVYDDTGVIVTNNHVLGNGEQQILVTLSDGRTLEASLLGRDPLEDLAVLKVDVQGLPVAKLGNSSDIKVGDDVVAIGNALALEGGLSVTRGIVSGLDRTIDTELQTQLQGIIQTDAAINRGNSGGPLVNSKGEVIGINTAIADPSFAQNVGFAIAIDRAKPIIEDLKTGIDRQIAFLGVAAQDVNERIARELSLNVQEGALIVEIQPGSPAADSDLRLEDVIVRIGSDRIRTANDMVSAIRTRKPGERVEIVFNRSGEELSTEVTLVERPL